MTSRKFCSSNNQNDMFICSGTLATPTSLASYLLVLFPRLLIDIVQYNQCIVTSWTHAEKLGQMKNGETNLLRMSQQNNKNFNHHASKGPCSPCCLFLYNLLVHHVGYALVGLHLNLLTCAQTSKRNILCNLFWSYAR